MDVYKRPNDATYLAYGTAGFRAQAESLDYVMFRVGLVASLRCCHVSKAIGVMITASHNPSNDNGVKIIDPNGDMLDEEWEQLIEKVVNSSNSRLSDELVNIKDKFNIDLDQHVVILTGRDTRESGPRLLHCLMAGIELMTSNCKILDFGLTTTPILHYLVAQMNQASKIEPIEVDAYYRRFISAFEKAFQMHDARSNMLRLNYDPKLIIDCSNGVGYLSINKLLSCLSDNMAHHLDAHLINGEGLLNHQCGADFVKSKKSPPSKAIPSNIRHASIDGDADRLVYFCFKNDHSFEIELIDGDKIACLFAIYLKELLQESELQDSLSFGIIQTAYANGSSTDYIRNKLGIRVDCVDTGVKNLLKRALNYDVAIYFEANGHGSIYFSDDARKQIQESGSKRLKLVDEMINPYVGDALTDILLVETILRQLDWSVKTWASIYTDKPNVLTKVSIKDKSVIETKDAGTRCTKPAKLQESIDSAVNKFGGSSRCFVRPSGTENFVRIYSEASTLDDARLLADLVAEQIKIHTQ